eukprot:m.22970 g.22970  ORF g.22970 m.22970 type:complete len:738 (+) comp9316_c0_seq1:1108-3321(+)
MSQLMQGVDPFALDIIKSAVEATPSIASPPAVLQVFKPLPPEHFKAVVPIQEITAQCPVGIGNSYSLKNGVLQTSVFKTGKEKEIVVRVNNVLYTRVPNYVDVRASATTKTRCMTFKTAEEFAAARRQELKVDASASKGFFSSQASFGMNVETSSKSQDQGQGRSFAFELAKAELTVRNVQLEDLQDSFVNACRKLPTKWLPTDAENVRDFEVFFGRFQTHFIHSVRIGGSIHGCLSESFLRKSAASTEEIQASLEAGFAGVFHSSVAHESETSSSTHRQIFSNVSDFRMEGGADMHHVANIDNVSPELMIKWRESLSALPALLHIDMQLQPVTSLMYLVDEKNPDEAIRDAAEKRVAAAEKACLHYMKEEAWKVCEQVIVNPTPPKAEKAPVVAPSENRDAAVATIDNSKKGGSCLLAGTPILCTSGWRAVESISVGDTIVDHKGRSRRVISKGHTFLFFRPLWQLQDGPVFTSDHLFHTSNGAFAAANLNSLYRENPQMVEENVVAMSSPSVNVLRMSDSQDSLRDGGLGLQAVSAAAMLQLYKPNVRLGPDTKVYFILVEGSGSYVAAKYVCQHEMPDVNKWPLTNLAVFAVATLVKTLHVPDTPAGLEQMTSLAEAVFAEWKNMESELTASATTSSGTITFEAGLPAHLENLLVPASLHALDPAVLDLLNQPVHVMWMGMGLYTTAGRWLHSILDGNRDKELVKNRLGFIISSAARTITLASSCNAIMRPEVK